MAVSMDGISSLSPELQRAFASAVQADRKPIERLTEQKGKTDARVQLLNDIVGKVDAVKSLLPKLNTPIAIRELALTSNDERVVSGTVDKNVAQPGSYSIEVLRMATPESAVSNGLPDKDSSRIGSGYFTFETASGETREVFIDNDNSTLEGVAKSINSANLGVKAGIINDQSDPDNPYRLVLSAQGTGSQNDVKYPDFYFIDGEEDFYIDKERPAQNALVRFQGHEFESPGNELKDVIAGVTLNIKGLTDPNRPGTITIDQDLPKTTLKIKDLVDKLNSVFSFIQTQSKMDEKTDTTKTLGGDYGIRLSEQRLRNALFQVNLTEPGLKVRSLGDIGIQFTKQGTLTFDEKKFESMLNSNFEEVVGYLTGDGQAGIIPALNRALNSISTPPDGVLASERKNESDKITKIDKDIAEKEKVADQKAQDLKGKLGRVQTAISSLQSQSASLAANVGGGGQNGFPMQILAQ